MPQFSEKFDEALVFASELHRTQMRKGTEIPYVSHLLSVASLVTEAGGTEIEAIAALLHDAVEDQGGQSTLNEISTRFGKEVADIVDACSDIEADKVTELNAARERLMMFLNAGGGDVTPIQTAKAQASFDCWLEQQEEKWQFDHIARCRDGFYAALDAVEPVVKPQVTLMFEFDSDVMDEEQRNNLELFAKYLEKFDAGAVVINGHADKAGTNPYNHSLSRARSIAVWRELIKAGVSPERVAISAYGEAHPVIDTPDGMREPLNRRAEVELRLPPLYATINQTTDLASTAE